MLLQVIIILTVLAAKEYLGKESNELRIVEYRYSSGLTNKQTLVKLINFGTYQILKILKNKLGAWLSNFQSSMPMISYNIYNHILLTTTTNHKYD